MSAGATEAISFCEMEERPYLRDIQKLIGRQVPVVHGHPYESAGAESVPAPVQPQRPARPQQQPERRQEAQQRPQRQQPASESGASKSAKRRNRRRYGNAPKAPLNN